MPSENPYNASVASKYDQLRSWRGAIPKRIVEISDLKPGMRFLDLGCGTGNLFSAIQDESGASALGLDLSREMLTVASGKLVERKASQEAILVQGDAAMLPFLDESFRAVTGAFFLHHIQEELRGAIFREAFRVLAKGAFTIVTRSHEQLATQAIPRFFPEVTRIDQARFPDIPAIEEWLRGAGFIEVRSELVESWETRIDEDYLERLSKKPISTLDLLTDEEFMAGMNRAREEVERTKGKLVLKGEFTVVWGKK